MNINQPLTRDELFLIKFAMSTTELLKLIKKEYDPKYYKLNKTKKQYSEN